MRPIALSLVLASALVPLAACGGGSSTGPGNDTLTSAEANALASVLLSESAQAGLSQTGSFAVASREAAATPIQYQGHVDAPCPGGGSLSSDVSLSGDIDQNTGAGTISLTLTEVHNSCSVTDAQSGTTFVLDGNPNLGVTFDVTLNQDQSYSMSGSYNGSVKWSTNGKSGTCSVGLDFQGSGSATGGTGTASESGSICGVNVSQSVTLG